MELLKLKPNELVIEVILSWAGIILAILTLYILNVRLVDIDTTMVMLVVFLMVLVNPVFSKFLIRFWKLKSNLLLFILNYTCSIIILFVFIVLL